MTDKELISIVDAKAKKLWDEINTGHEYSIIDSYNQFYGICMEIAEMVQEEPHCDERQFDELVKLQEGIGQIVKAIYEYKGKENSTVEKIREILIENSFDRMEIRGEISKREELVSEGKDIFDNCLKSKEKFILPQKISGNIDCENCLYSSACALGDIQACIIDKPVSDDLQEAAEKYWYNERPTISDIGIELYNGDKLRDTFKAGAKWQKEKMLENAVDGIITFDYYSNDDKEYGCIAHDSFCLEDMDLKDRDKVKIAIIK